MCWFLQRFIFLLVLEFYHRLHKYLRDGVLIKLNKYKI